MKLENSSEQTNFFYGDLERTRELTGLSNEKEATHA
jgi:hypothetical protein